MITDTFSKSGKKIPYLYGADAGSISYSQEFIKTLQQLTGKTDVSSVLHRFTYHNYPNCNYPGNGSVFDLSCLERIDSASTQFGNIGRSGKTVPLMGEGSEHGGGGLPNVSDTFVDSFYYLYQLCDILEYGILGTARSDLVGGDYELIDHETFLPNPDYWILYLFKMFIGDTMYSSKLSPSDGNFRAYAFNGKNDNDVVMALINFDLNNDAQITWSISNSVTYNANEYYLKTVGDSLQSRIMSVNNVSMVYSNGVFPKFEPIKGNGNSATLEPSTIAFVVLTAQ